MTTWYSFDWRCFVTDAFLTRLVTAGGLPDTARAALRQHVEPVAAELLAAIGGQPVAPRPFDAAERTAIALALLGEALQHALAPARLRRVPGYTKSAGSTSRRAKVVARERVQLHIAPPSVIEDLPGIGPVLAGRIVEERRRRPFRDLDDLGARVSGIGPAMLKDLKHAVDMSLPAIRAEVPAGNELDPCWRAFLAGREAPDPVTLVVQALEVLLLHVRSSARPRSRILREETPGPAPAVMEAENVGVLEGSRYYQRVQELIAAAARKLDVCLFHIALPTEDHPTAKLLAVVRDAHRRGVAVRVLVDRDRPEDAYKSTVINAPAVKYLRDAGVPVRQDAPERLLHSKFLVIDDDLALVGSHNWSAGSFFQLDDITLVIRSAQVAAAQRRRFESLWGESA